MAEAGKKRTRQQRTGKIGEDLLRDGKWIIGVHVREIRDAGLELLAQRFDKTDAPELVLTPDWRSVSLTEKNKGSDCTTWGVALVDFDDSEDQTPDDNETSPVDDE